MLGSPIDKETRKPVRLPLISNHTTAALFLSKDIQYFPFYSIFSLLLRLSCYGHKHRRDLSIIIEIFGKSFPRVNEKIRGGK